jgi:hypothetical protein
MALGALLDVSKPSLYLSLASITFNPTAWNIVARNGKPSPFAYASSTALDIPA